jgi:hypothetical protein
MQSNNSPLESLAAFSIAFVAGLVSASGLAAYVAYVKKCAVREHIKSSEQELNPPFRQQHGTL